MSNHISSKKVWIKTDGWRGYEQPITSVGGCNNTGGWEDSPCPTHVCESEINGFRSILRKNKIRSRVIVGLTSNVFCIHVYVCVHPNDKERGLELSREYQNREGIRLFYVTD